MGSCSAPWYELNLSAPDGNVAACCYYSGKRDPWLDDSVDISHYWNGPSIREARRTQKGAIPSPNGCSSCFYFNQVLPGQNYYSFANPPADTSSAQLENWHLAKSEYEAKVEQASCMPLRIYANFGFGCNLSCTMCHQVPRRSELKRQILAETVLNWHEALTRCLDFSVIGGEPLTLSEGLKFIRKFAPDERYDATRLSVYTNGTLVQKHWDTWKTKRKLSFTISLDSIGMGYEAIRVGGRWSEVERNILDILKEKAKSHPDWGITTNANMQKTGIPYLPEFAKWHVKHQIHTFFYDFISAPGVEDTYHRDNILHNSQLLDSIPNWRDLIDEAVGVFRSAGWGFEADQLEQYRNRVAENAEKQAKNILRMRSQQNRSDWASVTYGKGERNWSKRLEAYPTPGKPPIPTVEIHGLVAFKKTRIGDYFATPFINIKAPRGGTECRVRASWPKVVPEDPYMRLAHIILKDHKGNQLQDFREYRNSGDGTELILIVEIPKGMSKIQAVLTPLGEENTLLPESLEIEMDSRLLDRALNYESSMIPKLRYFSGRLAAIIRIQTIHRLTTFLELAQLRKKE